MTTTEILTKWVNRDNHGPRTIGRYWPTDIYAIKEGYLTVSNFFSKKRIYSEGAANIITGMASEDMLSRIFKDMKMEFEPQARMEIALEEGIILSGKPDFLFKDKVIECKCPNPKTISSNTTTIPNKWKDQLESYWRAYGLPVYLCRISHPFRTSEYLYTPDDKRWEKNKQIIKDFDLKLKKHYK